MDRIKILEEYDDWVIRSEYLTMNVPAVAVTKDYFKFKKAAKFSRSNLFLRDLYQCQYCGDTFDHKDLTLDHVRPRSKGGKTNWENSVTSCRSCNFRKGVKDWEPLRTPYKPDHFQLINKWKQRPIQVRHPSWYNYLGIEVPSKI